MPPPSLAITVIIIIIIKDLLFGSVLTQLWNPEELGTPGIGVTGTCELLVGTGNQTLVLCNTSAFPYLPSHLSNPEGVFLKHVIF